MFFYIFIFSLTAFFSYIELLSSKRRNNRIVLYLLSLLLFLFSFLRWEVGTDWDTYYSLYQALDWGGFWVIEPIFASVIVFAKSIYPSFTFALFLLACILFYFQTKSLKFLSVYPVISLFVIVGMQFGNVFFVRQSIAQAIAMFSIYYIIKKDLFKFCLCILVAFGFHTSALIFLPSYWIFNIKWSIRKILIFTISSVFFSGIVSYLLSSIGNILGEAIAYRLDFYMNEGYEDQNNYSPMVNLAKSLANKGLFYFLYIYYHSKRRNCENMYLFDNYFMLFAFGTILFFLVNPIHSVFGRMCRYYDAAQIFLIPYFFVFCKSKQSRSILFVMLFLFLYMKLYLYVNSYDNLFIPFKTIWSS